MARSTSTDERCVAIGGTTVRVPSDCRCRAAVTGDPPGLDREAAAQLAHLYLCKGLSTYRIADTLGLDRQRITRMLRRAGVPMRPRGAGGTRPQQRRPDPSDLPELLADLYLRENLNTAQIAAVLGIPERTIRNRLHQYKIQARTRGAWNREDRRTVPPDVLDEFYTKAGFTANEVGRKLGASIKTVLRSAHDYGIPVRVGGAVDQGGPDEIELVNALYADPVIAATLTKYKIAPVPPGGPIWDRFPEPVPLTKQMVEELYWHCGAGLNHIELLTGRPATTIRGFMHRSGIGVRHSGGRSPFMRRWRTGSLTSE
jgi:hypothetical protein